MRSLQGKILLVYLALAALAVGLSLVALVEINLIARKTEAGSKVAEFFDATLEVRRFEKNHFLYGQPQDLRENTRYTDQALDLLRRDREAFDALIGATRALDLERDLTRYGQLMAEHAHRTGDEQLAAEVRALGYRIVTAGETLAAKERQSLRDALAKHQHNLLVSVAAVVALLLLAGFSLARWVTRPLKAMETSMDAIANGQLTRLGLDVSERELASLTQAFNHVLDELERRQHTLVRAEKLASLGTLLSGVAHELNNPLSNISSSAQILNEDADIAPDMRRELLTDIDHETRRAATIVRSLLDYARDRDFQRQPVNLAELIDETLRFLKTLKAPGIELKLAVPADLAVAADRPRLQQALLNLIKNAFEAMGDYGELSIEAHRGTAGRSDDAPMRAGSCRPGAAVIDLTVSDTGPGIPPEVLPRIFDPFFTTKPVGHGNGLGLFIVHEIIDEHGGCIGADNLPEGRGARFRIRLPLGAPPSEEP
jgi:signal transduction histidine kinase